MLTFFQAAEPGEAEVIVLQGTSVDIPGIVTETSPRVQSQAKQPTPTDVDGAVNQEESEDTLSDVMEPSPRMELPTRMTKIRYTVIES